MSMHGPNLASPIAGSSPVTVPWSKFFRELIEHVNAEMSPGRIQPFYLLAADLVDAEQFIQAGATAGLGVGIRRGWAVCNGNNGTPTLDGKSLRWSTAAAGALVGADSVALAEANLPPHSHAATTTGADGTHGHTGSNYSTGETVGVDTYNLNDATGATPFTAFPNTGAHGHTISVGNGAGTSTPVATIPASKTLVPMMRV